MAPPIAAEALSAELNPHVGELAGRLFSGLRDDATAMPAHRRPALLACARGRAARSQTRGTGGRHGFRSSISRD